MNRKNEEKLRFLKYLVRFCSFSMLIFSLEVSSVYRMPDVDARLIIIFQEACQETGPRMR